MVGMKSGVFQQLAQFIDNDEQAECILISCLDLPRDRFDRVGKCSSGYQLPLFSVIAEALQPFREFLAFLTIRLNPVQCRPQPSEKRQSNRLPAAYYGDDTESSLGQPRDVAMQLVVEISIFRA